MNNLMKFGWAVVLAVGTGLPVVAQLSVTPQANISLPVSHTRDYATPRTGYGLELGYRLADRWSLTAAYNIYRLKASAELEDINISSTLVSLLNLPESFDLELQISSWSGGIRYLIRIPKVTPFLGAAISSNHIAVDGYGLSLERRYWGIAPALGLEWPFAPRWSLETSARAQTVFVREKIPIVDQLIQKHIGFVSVQAGLVFRIGLPE